MAHRPLVNVCIPVHNQARYLGDALRSVLCQTVQDFEVIVCDDGSSDFPLTVVQEQHDERIRYFRRRSSGGVAVARNGCLREARGLFIAWLDADDVYEPGALESLSQTLLRHPDAALVHGGFELIDARGAPLRPWEPPFQEDTIEDGASAFRELSLVNYVVTSTVMVRTEAQERGGGFDPHIGRSSTDWDMWLRLALLGNIAYCAKPVASYRQHPESISARTTRDDERLLCDERCIAHVLGDPGPAIEGRLGLQRMARAALAFRWLERAGQHSLHGRRLAAANATWRAFRLSGRRALLPSWATLIRAQLADDEYGSFSARKALMGNLHEALEGTRYGEKVRKLARVEPDWVAEQQEIAKRIQQVTEPGSAIAVVDKHDPTLLHLSGRPGRHFPELPGVPKGQYPRDPRQAIDHLEALCAEGVAYFVLPSPGLWWLDFYREFADHLRTSYECVWSDEHVLIYRLSRPAGRPTAIRSDYVGVP